MTDIQIFNAQARAAYEKLDYHLAFLILCEKVGVDHCISYAMKVGEKPKKTNWLTEESSSKYFFGDFILQNNRFETLLTSKSAMLALYQYFTKSKLQISDFEDKLAGQFPELYVKAIRINQVFLLPERMQRLNSVQLKKKFALHQEIWREISKTENSIWQEIEKCLGDVIENSLSQILSLCIIYLETSRFKQSSLAQTNHIASVYSFFIELVMTRCKGKDIISIDNFQEQFFHEVHNFEKTINNIAEIPVAKLLGYIDSWIAYNDQIIIPYSFDLNTELIEQGEEIILVTNPEKYYSWRVGGARYDVNRLAYQKMGQAISSKVSGNLPPKSIEGTNIKKTIEDHKYATLKLLNDLGYSTFKFRNTETKIEQLLTPLISYSLGKYIKYDMPLNELSPNSQNWVEAYLSLLKLNSSGHAQILPFFLKPEKDQSIINTETLSCDPKVSTSDITNYFGYKQNQKADFNRFNRRYDVYLKPFLNINGFLFCPQMFLSSNTWFYSFAQVALSQPAIRLETKKMEDHFGKLFEQKGWKVKITTDENAGEMEGDIDLFVEDQNSLLYIQLKRTKFRLNFKEAYDNLIYVDHKAAKQLNEAESFLNKPNPVFNPKMKPVKWIVSTSFENIGDKIDDCLKVNYFEVLAVLNNPKIRNLSALIEEIESDIYIRNAYDDLRSFSIEDVSSLEMFTSNAYRISIYSRNKEKTVKTDELYAMANCEMKKGNPKEAFDLYIKCVEENPNDGESFNAIASIFANCRKYDPAIATFERALNLLPNDPYILREFSSILIESGRVFDGLTILLNLTEKYPLLGDLKDQFQKNLQIGISTNILSQKEIIHLYDRSESMM